jgi:hypothetical protein
MPAASGRMARAGIAVLTVVVGALVLSWGWATFRPRKPAPRAGPERRVIRVQVWNGSGEGGIGARVASHLREGGFHVIEVRNADRPDYFATLVVARRDDVTLAETVAAYLGGPPVLRQTSGADAADVTVVIGRDRSRLRLDD